MLGELLARHPPAAVWSFTLPESRAALRAIHEDRARQIELMAAMLGAQLGT